MLSWRSWSSPSTSPRYYWRDRVAQRAPAGVRRRGLARRRGRRDGCLSPVAERDVDAVRVPDGGDDLARGARHGPEERLVAGSLDRAGARRADYLCLHRDRPRGGHLAGRLYGRVRRAEEETHDRAPERP